MEREGISVIHAWKPSHRANTSSNTLKPTWVKNSAVRSATNYSHHQTPCARTPRSIQDSNPIPASCAGSRMEGKNTCGDTPSYIQRASGSSVPSVRNHSTTSARCKSIRGVTPATDHTVVTCATGHSPLRPTCRRTASASSTGTSLNGRTRLVDCRRQLINHW